MVFNVGRHQKGFTIIEIMVVVAVIGILAAIGLPRLTAFLRTAETDEPVQQFGRISKALTGYISTHQEGIAALTGAINDYGDLKTTPGTTELTSLIPHLSLASDAVFDYRIVSGYDSNSNLQFCIKATGNANSGNSTGTVLFSSERVSVANGPTWENNINRVNYVDGSTAGAGGCCTASGGYNTTNCGTSP